MNMQEKRIADVWQMTLRCYEADGVKQACLELQDRHGIGVSALFALLSLAVLGHRLSDASVLASVLKRAEQWQASVVEPLRLARRNTVLNGGKPEAQAAAADLRQRLLQQEIEAEALQQRLLIHDFLTHATAAGSTERADVQNAAMAYLDRFIAAPDRADKAAIETIVAAFFDQRS